MADSGDKKWAKGFEKWPVYLKRWDQASWDTEAKAGFKKSGIKQVAKMGEAVLKWRAAGAKAVKLSGTWGR